MITPNEDKQAIKAILDTDPYIINKAQFNPVNIKTTKYGTDVLNNSSSDFQIFIYLGNPENPNVYNQKGIVFNIAVVGRRERSVVVDSVSSQVIALLVEAEIGHGHILHLLDPPMELESDPSIYIVETAFICYETIYNQIKT